MRFFLWMVLGYVVWKVIQIVMRTMSSSRPREDVFTNQTPPKNAPKKFSNVEDADFEDLPPEEKK